VEGAAYRMRLELIARGADRVKHRHDSLLKHLVGTYELLRLLDRRTPVCLAGLAHSVYSTDVFLSRLIPLTERNGVRELIGPEAEQLTCLFSAVKRQEFFAKAERGAPSSRLPTGTRKSY